MTTSPAPQGPQTGLPKGKASADPSMAPLEVSNPSMSVPPRSVSARATLQQRQNHLMRIAVAVSIVAHVAVFAAWLVWPQPSRAAVDLDEAIIKTRLVKLGKPRDEKLLPRLPTSPPPPPKVDKKPDLKVEPDKKPDTLPKPEADTKPSAADILEKFKNDAERPKELSDIINDRIGEPTEEGRPDGDKEGAALDGEVTASYFARVLARVQNKMEVSSVLTDEERVRLRAVVCFKIAEDGSVSDITVKSSGSQIYDADVVAAARRASPVPAPPPPARRQAAEGVCFNACPKSCS